MSNWISDEEPTGRENLRLIALGTIFPTIFLSRFGGALPGRSVLLGWLIARGSELYARW
ncbi:MAG TPA: hypothetical protein VHZ09_04780 [Acidobacteriaceae bacterium]|jgi:hypothetical protein|nr:hypothetical protein [Acidobacteriaceae bacterium]